MTILETLRYKSKQNKKSIAVLIDPDKVGSYEKLTHLIDLANENYIDYFMIGGSLITSTNLPWVISTIKKSVSIPVVIFPGNSIQISSEADGILFLSLISGRNPDLLIGQHVVTAPILRSTNLEIIPTGYILINSGKITSVAYVSNTTPIPNDKPSLAVCTAMAGEMLGLQTIYLDAGSGAEREISVRMISAVRKAVKTPLIVGGGIDTSNKAMAAFEAGADMIVLGNILERNPNLLIDISDRAYDLNQTREGKKSV